MSHTAVDTPEPGPRDVLMSAWFLGKRNLWLMLWHWLSGMVTSGLAVMTAVVIVVALLVPLGEYDTNTAGGLVGYVLTVISRVTRPGFVIPLLGLLTTLSALNIAVAALVQGGVYGRLAHALRPDGQRAGFWRCATRHFATFVGYTAVRMLLELAIAGVGVAVVVVPLLRGASFVSRTDQIPVTWAVLAGLGAALTVLAWGMVWAWRMIALGPLLLDERPLWSALGDAAVHLGTHLWGWLRLLAGMLLVLSPLVLVWGSFAVLLTGVSSQPELANIGLLGQLALDTVMGLATSVLFVLVAAAFLVRYALVEGIVEHAPSPATSSAAARPAPTHAMSADVARVPLRFGQPLALPGAASLVVMPLPARFPNVVRFDDILAPMAPEDLPPVPAPPAPEPPAYSQPEGAIEATDDDDAEDDGWLDIDLGDFDLDHEVIDTVTVDDEEVDDDKGDDLRETARDDDPNDDEDPPR